MEKLRAALVILMLTFVSGAKGQHPMPGIIPRPQFIRMSDATFKITASTNIICNRYSYKEAYLFKYLLKRTYGLDLHLRQTNRPLDNSINIFPSESLDKNDSYKIFAGTYSVLAMGREDGITHSIQTLLQMVQHDTLQDLFYIPGAQITDHPRFSWRGMHLDVSRHFFSPDFIKRYIDHLARYKMNVFHWHLTDDQGWRIEIKKYPELASKGAWRKASQTGPYRNMEIDSTPYGGYYTQKDIKEIVEYATSRRVRIVPEIEMPGHALAALTAYPKLACRDSAFEVSPYWGVFEDVFCPKEETFTFLQDVLTEVMELFPSPYIHIGGDECPKTRWKACSHCQELKKKEGLKDEHELQSYFIKRISSFVQSKGRKIIGWDEILEGGLAPDAAVMSWRGTEGGKEAARQKHEVVMTPGQFCYFDHYQSLPDSLEPWAIGGYTPVEKVYSFEPVPDSLSKKEQQFILGAQGNVWTEYILNNEHVEYMSMPRMCALAEVLWLDPAQKNYADFRQRLIKHATLLDRLNVKYAPHVIKGQTP